jgi:hypothetical protein
MLRHDVVKKYRPRIGLRQNFSSPFYAVVYQSYNLVKQDPCGPGQYAVPSGYFRWPPFLARPYFAFNPKASVHEGMHPATALALKLFEFMRKIIDGRALLFEETDTIIAPQIIPGVHTQNRDRIFVFQQPPCNRCNMVDIVEVPHEEKEHGVIFTNLS